MPLPGFNQLCSPQLMIPIWTVSSASSDNLAAVPRKVVGASMSGIHAKQPHCEFIEMIPRLPGKPGELRHVLDASVPS